MPTVLSVQSRVAYGHVGNAASVFPLQRLGIEAWALDTVAFSNHTGHGQWRGSVVPAVQIAEGSADSVFIAARDLTGILGQPRFEGEIAMRTSVPGVATGLAWTPVGGDILFTFSLARSPDDVAAGDACAVGLKDALQAKTFVVAFDLA